MSKKILIELNQDTEKMLRQRAEALGVSLSECVEKILEMVTESKLVHIDLLDEQYIRAMRNRRAECTGQG